MQRKEDDYPLGLMSLGPRDKADRLCFVTALGFLGQKVYQNQKFKLQRGLDWLEVTA